MRRWKAIKSSGIVNSPFEGRVHLSQEEEVAKLARIGLFRVENCSPRSIYASFELKTKTPSSLSSMIAG